MWSTIILCNFQSCNYFCFGRCIVWGKISNYWFITFWMKTKFTWNQVDPALWNGVFPEFFSDKNKNWTKLVGCTFWTKNNFYVKSGWSCSLKWGYPGIFVWQTKLNQTFNGSIPKNLFGKKPKTIGNSTPCTELRCWNAM